MSGKVTLIGAGPGDPELITLKGLKRLRAADVIIHDLLIPISLLEEAKDGAEIIDAGKAPDAHKLKQDQINETIIDRAKRGLHVVRLKGGDPYIFGRGDEEALICHEHSIPVEVVPGISSVTSVPLYAGMPLTHRSPERTISGFMAITGQEDPTKPTTNLDYALLAKFDGTLMILMGLKQMPHIFAKLIECGRSADTPAAVVEWGATDKQRIVTGTLTTLPQLAEAANIGVPASILIGETVMLQDRLPVGVGLDDEQTT
ncbi:MAG: uroporphyrinogen-III C-methyltransferase [Chloroflexi bacterium]|nr:uroporphyrinogen-III C-methyltransferase [Chloroflexota bacterium]